MAIERNKLLLTSSVLLSGLIAAGVYIYFDDTTNKEPVFDSAQGTDAARHSVVSEIERINAAIAALQNGVHRGRRGDVASQLTKLRAEMKSLRDQLNALSGSVPLEQSVEDGLASERLDAAMTEEEREQHLKAQMEEQIASFETAATVEGVDPEWEPTAKAEVLESFQALREEGVGVSDVQCHTSFCRARFHLDSQNVNASLRKLQSVSPWKGGTFIWVEDIEQGEGLMYLARDGHRLPS